VKISLPVSAVIFTKNEESNIQQCIASLEGFSEIVVIDSVSTDSTKYLAKQAGAKVIDFVWNGKYPKKRQWCLDEVDYQNKWILFIDADERVPQSLKSELSAFFNDPGKEFSAGSIPIDYYFSGKRLKYGQRPRKITLIQVGHVAYAEVDDLSAIGMGELEGHYQPTVNGKVAKFKSRIIHHDNDPISSWMRRHINYANWEAHLLVNPDVKDVVDTSKGSLVALFHKLPLRPLVFFLYSYIYKRGFLDGRAGFDYAFAKSWYYWLSDVIAREEMQHDK
jgi:glycosyltransferase involved in cell wall biosynthesis